MSFNYLVHSFVLEAVVIDFQFSFGQIFCWRRFPWLREHRVKVDATHDWKVK